MQLVVFYRLFIFMGNVIQIDMKVKSAEQGEIIIAELAETGFHGFQENDNFLSAFINEDLFKDKLFQSILSKLNISYTKNIIGDINWNQKWEDEFRPVLIDSFVAIRAPFHAPINEVQHEIIITPKMSFGTGHHATTFLILQQMKEIDFKNKSVLDFGTGTGVLAILANKLGASAITAIDNDERCIENAAENFKTNNCNNILLVKNDSASNLGVFDIILANINLNVIKSNITNLKEACHPGTQLLLSGFLLNDESELKYIFYISGFQAKEIKQKDEWLYIALSVKN